MADNLRIERSHPPRAMFCFVLSELVCLCLVGGLCGDGEGRFAADCTAGADLLSAPDKTGFLTCQMFRHLSKVFVVDTLKHTSSTIKPHTSVVAVKEFCKDQIIILRTFFLP